MSDIKSDFREWLQKQKYLPKTIKQYTYNIDKLCSDLYESKDWNRFSEDALYFLAKYSEYANREYYLDIITIRYALDYFRDFWKDIKYSNVMQSNKKQSIQLYLYINKRNYVLERVSFEELYGYLSVLNSVLYGRLDEKKLLSSQQVKDFKDKLEHMLKQLSVKDRKMIAIHIKYEKINSYSKLSLSKYCLFLQKSYPTNIYFAMIPSIVHKIKTKNPNKTVNGHYKIVQQITGCQPLKIEATNEQERLDINFTLTKTDLSKIFNLHLATVDKILKRNNCYCYATRGLAT